MKAPDPKASSMIPSLTRIRGVFKGGHRDDSGAVAMLCLAAVLALMLIAWVILDVQKSTRDKVMLQGAADTAAFSHAAVEARTMNMISYANIAKRSVVGIHSLYPGMFFAYTLWLAGQAADCFKIWPNPSACIKFFANAPQWAREFLDDHVKYSGSPTNPYVGGVFQTIQDVVGWITDKVGIDFGIDMTSGMSGGNSDSAYGKDVQALDNYQSYMRHITPWWAWSEQLSRAWRNGASTAASFPPPPGDITVTLSSVQNLINTINGVLAAFGASTIDLTVYHGNDNLPVSKSSYSWHNWLCQMFMGAQDCGLSDLSGFSGASSLATLGNESFILEHILNAALHYKNSSKGAKSGMVMAVGPTVGFATVGIQYSRLAFGEYADPHTIDTGLINDEADWLEHTSNLVFAYSNDPKRMNEDRAKLSVPSQEYELSGSIVDELMYGASGYWTMSKSEITFNGQGWNPDMWHPSWTARMRPVHLPDEFEDAGYNMNVAYNQALPYLALSAQVASVNGNPVNSILNSIRDFAMMELSSAAMGPSTIEGVAK